MSELDHITVAAHTLEQGLAHLRTVLGIELPAGGEHPRMGTHNRVLRLGDAVFLELIAVNPAAPAPDRPRWFQLDDAQLQAELRIAPRLLTWVVRTHDIARTSRASERPLGEIEPMRRGELRWLITIPGDGTLPDGGMLPALIQWPEGPHPASRMPELGCTLDRFEAAHPAPAAYQRHLASIGAEQHVQVSASSGPAASLVAHIRTPHGVRILR
jgi:hypothetical protein